MKLTLCLSHTVPLYVNSDIVKLSLPLTSRYSCIRREGQRRRHRRSFWRTALSVRRSHRQGEFDIVISRDEDKVSPRRRHEVGQHFPDRRERRVIVEALHHPDRGLGVEVKCRPDIATRNFSVPFPASVVTLAPPATGSARLNSERMSYVDHQAAVVYTAKVG